MAASTKSGPGVYEKLGIRPVINAQGGVTDLGGSILIPSVRRAMDETSDSFVSMGELLEKSGEYIAGILGVEAAYVESGLEGIAGARTEKVQSPYYYVRIAMHVVMDTAVLGKDARQVARELMEGKPRVGMLLPDDNTIEVRSYNLYDGEEAAIAEELRSVLSS